MPTAAHTGPLGRLGDAGVPSVDPSASTSRNGVGALAGVDTARSMPGAAQGTSDPPVGDDSDG